jgi:hypothetical protein
MKRDDLLRLARLAVQIARTQLPDYASKFAPKRYTQPALLACLCLKEYLHVDYRSTEALLASAQELREALGLHAVPDHSMLWWFSRHKVKPGLLARILRRSACSSAWPPSLAHGGRGFHGLCTRLGQPLLPAAGRSTPPRPHVAEVVGSRLDRPLGVVWAGGRPGSVAKTDWSARRG